MIGLSCYILADTFFISNGLGTNGLTALNLAKHRITKQNHFHIQRLKHFPRLTKDTLCLSVPSLITEVASGIVMIIFNIIILRLQQTGKYKKILTYAIIATLLLSGCIYGTFLLCTDAIINIFNNEQNILLQQIAENGLKLYFTAIPFAGFNIVLSTHFTSTEKAIQAQTVSLSRGFFLIIPMAFFLSHTLGMTGVWLSYPVTVSL